jgi:hypothetical protein
MDRYSLSWIAILLGNKAISIRKIEGRDAFTVTLPSRNDIWLKLHGIHSELTVSSFSIPSLHAGKKKFLAIIMNCNGKVLKVPVFRIRIRKFLGLSVRAMDPNQGSFHHQAKIVRKTLIVTSLWLFIREE